MMEEYLEKDGFKHFKIKKVIVSIGYIDINVEEVIGWDCDDNSPCEFEQYLGVAIKFDGLFHFTFGENDGYIAIDSNEIELHCELLLKIKEIAKNHFKNEYIN